MRPTPAKVDPTGARSHASRAADRVTAFYSSAFGLSLCSTLPLPGLLAHPAVPAVDLSIWLESSTEDAEVPAPPARLWYATETDATEAPTLRVWRDANGDFSLLYSDGTAFFVNRAGTHVRGTWPASLTLDDAATYLLGPVLGLVLRLRGVTCLHASAIAIDGRAVAFVGPPGAGKSTIAAAFVQNGYPMLADDIVALSVDDTTTYVQPAYPQVRLWPESVTLLYGAADVLPRLTPTGEKRALRLAQDDGRFQAQRRPLAAIHLLTPGASGTEPRVERLHSRQALLALVSNTSASYVLNAAMRHAELGALAQLVSYVPVRRLVRPGDVTSIADVCRSVLDDVKGLECTASPSTE